MRLADLDGMDRQGRDCYGSYVNVSDLLEQMIKIKSQKELVELIQELRDAY